jgi:hypothetical protein
VPLFDRLLFVANGTLRVRVVVVFLAVLAARAFGPLFLSLVSDLPLAFLVGRWLLGGVALFACLCTTISFLIVLPVLLLSGHAGSFRLRVPGCISIGQIQTQARRAHAGAPVAVVLRLADSLGVCSACPRGTISVLLLVSETGEYLDRVERV